MPKSKKAKSEGHVAHTKAADSQIGLPGKMPRSIKIVMLGAGSAFTPRLMNDVLRIPGNRQGEIALVDIDKKRLLLMDRMIKKLAAQLGADDWKVTSTTNRRSVMKGAHYLVNCIEVSGTACVRHDNDIPAKYGIDQCIGDTIGPGGLFKALRTIPVWLKVLKDAEELCPNAIILNYTNPMNMVCLASARSSSMSLVGLCHSVQGTSHLLARRAGVPYDQLDWECAGINHLAWFTKLEHKGRNLYPKLYKLAERDIRLGSKKLGDDRWDLVRKDMMLHFGAFITESSGHLSEYLPYYRKRKDILRTYCRSGYHGGTSFYANEWPSWRRANDRARRSMVSGKLPMDWPRSWEYASWIIEAREKNKPFTIHGNVMNKAKGAGPLISNLSGDACVEVACTIDRNGINPMVYGRLPAQMAAICESNIRMFDLAAQAAVEKSIDAAIHALMLDPLTAAVCSPAEIKKMTLELFRKEKKFLKGYR